MKRIVFMVAGFAAVAAAAMSPVQLQAYLVQAGVDPFDAGARRQYRVHVVNGEHRLYGDWSVPGVAEPGEADFLPEAEASAALAAWLEQRDGGKSDELKALENEYFDLVDAIYAEAGEDPPAEGEARNPRAARAKAASAKTSKGGGQHPSADDLLELTELRIRLLEVEAALTELNRNWRRNATRHD